MILIPSLFSLLVAASPTPDGGTLLPPPKAFAVVLDDPLLEPMPRPATNVGSFEQALSLVHQTSTDERVAEAAVHRAQGRWRQALAAMLPNSRLSLSAAMDILNPSRLPIGAGANVPLADGPVALGTANLTLSQTLVDLSAWRGLASASYARASAEESLIDVRRRLTLGLARTLVAVVAVERVAELNRLALAQALERAALTERTARLGAAMQLDVIRVQQDVDVARGTLIAGDEQLRRAREALGLVLGAPGEVGVEPSLNLDSLIMETRRRCPPVDWDGRADLNAARANVESAEKLRQQAVAGYLPSLGLNSAYTGLTTTAQDPFRFQLWTISAVITVPIWEGGARGGIIEERRSAVTQAEQALEQQRRLVSVEVARARRGVQVAAALRNAAAQARDSAAQLDALTRRAFEVGRGTSLELVQTAAALRQADVALATREFEWVSARLDAFLTEARCD